MSNATGTVPTGRESDSPPLICDYGSDEDIDDKDSRDEEQKEDDLKERIRRGLEPDPYEVLEGKDEHMKDSEEDDELAVIPDPLKPKKGGGKQNRQANVKTQKVKAVPVKKTRAKSRSIVAPKKMTSKQARSPGRKRSATRVATINKKPGKPSTGKPSSPAARSRVKATHKVRVQPSRSKTKQTAKSIVKDRVKRSSSRAKPKRAGAAR